MLWTLIPAKPFRQSKTRLGPLFDAQERARLSAAMLTHTLGVTREAFGQQHIIVVTPQDRDVAQIARAAGSERIFVSSSHGLNGQLTEAASIIPAEDDVLVLHADLPLLSPEDLLELVSMPTPFIIAADSTGFGSNALLQRTAKREFRFGAHSCERHLAYAQACGISPVIVRRDGLAHDLDDPSGFHRLGTSLGHLIDRLLKFEGALQS